MIKTYNEAVKFVESFIPTPKDKYLGRLALERMKYLVKIAGNPQFRYPTIHVGGTAGKGSTTTIIASILGTKIRVGSNISPHLVEIKERIKINGVDISKYDFLNLMNQLVSFIEKMMHSKYGRPSTFELITLGAFLYFLQRQVDVAVMEVGLGGRYDGTNVIKPGVVVLTNVGLDHTQALGNTIEKIAEDKVGIIKEGVVVVSGVKQKSVVDIVKAKCKEKKANLYLLGKDFRYEIKRISDRGSVFDYISKSGSDLEGVKGLTLKNLELSLLGEHQVENAAIAIRAIECFNATMNNATINETDIRNGLKRAFIPGRMEIARRNPLVILDGAHNPDKVKALVQAMQTIFPKKKVKALVAIKKDKDAREILKKLLPICQNIIISAFRLRGDIGEIASYAPESLRSTIYGFAKTMNVSIVPKAKHAYTKILKEANKDDIILVTGSLYLVGEIRRILHMRD